MMESGGGIIVGVLGQWASGKTTASRTLIRHLGGEDKVAFINDQYLFAGQAVKYLLALEDSQITCTLEADGTRRLEGEYAKVWLDPGEDLKSVDLSTLRWNLHEDVMPEWLNRARVEVGHQIREKSRGGSPIVIEAGFGPHPVDHTVPDLFAALEEAGVEPKQVKWIIVEAGYDRRSERNRKRRVVVPVDLFRRYAVGGGDLDPEHQNTLEKQGITVKRVRNEHDDVERFRSDIIAAFEEIFGAG